ncbi:MAG TPA: hypothetical protein VFC87_05080 [Perlabentimonas sp.]|nr:hypothetical protein [Perlabentimonas sp.]
MIFYSKQRVLGWIESKVEVEVEVEVEIEIEIEKVSNDKCLK